MEGVFLSSVRKSILEEARRLVPMRGFNDPSVFHMALAAVRDNNTHEGMMHVDNVNFFQMFPRGFPIAIVEDIVCSTNRATHQRLEERFNKTVLLDSILKSSEVFSAGQRKVPNIRDVVEEALLTRLNILKPYKKRWAEAVALEYIPINLPATLKNVTEFVDTTCYYVERIDAFGAAIASGDKILQSPMHNFLDIFPGSSNTTERHSFLQSTEERFWRSFLSSVPLSGASHIREELFGCRWYANRAKIAATFSLAMLSFIGEDTVHYVETKEMVRSVTDTLF